MADKKNLCAQIDTALHARVRQEQEQSGKTLSEYVEQLITDYLAISPEKPGNVDWEKVFEGVDWFHITGITPAISKSAMEPFLESVKEAKKRNITVSCDLNYRKNL